MCPKSVVPGLTEAIGFKSSNGSLTRPKRPPYLYYTLSMVPPVRGEWAY